MTFDPDGGREYGPDAWLWPCGCAVKVHEPGHLVVKACCADHDDVLEQFTLGTVSEVNAEAGRPMPEVGYVHPENN